LIVRAYQKPDPQDRDHRMGYVGKRANPAGMDALEFIEGDIVRPEETAGVCFAWDMHRLQLYLSLLQSHDLICSRRYIRL